MKRIFFFLLVNVLLSASVFSQLKMPAVFSNNMVLQQNSDVAIWGWANPNAKITLSTSWDKKTYQITADASGNWKTNVSTPVASFTKQTIIILAPKRQKIILENILIGEVWICSGQSNMEMPLAGWGKVNNFEEEIANANFPNIRLLQVERATSKEPLNDVKVASGQWQECSPATVALFSSVGYFFGRDLFQKLNVPIGLIHTSWGGTVAEAWISKKSLSTMPDFDNVLKQIDLLPQNKEERNKYFEQEKEKWEADVIAKDFGFINGNAVVAQTSFNDGDWKSMFLPEAWEKQALPDFDGIVWFRKTIDIPSGFAEKELVLRLAQIDDNDITYFNGVKIGQTEGWDKLREYKIPAHLAKAGKAIITVRVHDNGEGGGFHGDKEDMFLAPNANLNSKLDISGNWKYKTAIDSKEIKPLLNLADENPNVPTHLFNAMLKPLIPFTIKGAIWYQGESNASRAKQYQDLFPLMINDWRTHWGYNFPFYYVQLANYKEKSAQPTDADWARLREAQSKTLALENTGMAVTVDIGDALDIHPKNKQDVGYRLALIAQNQTYNLANPYSGPQFESYKIEGYKIRIKFRHTNGGLKANGNKLEGFSIAGVDHKFYWGQATIDGDEVVVQSPLVTFPLAVRYAWADNPTCNLYNGAGLPASPFRTDNW